MEYDVWQCYTNWRTTYKAVPAKGEVEDAKPPENAIAHLDRVMAANKRQAIHLVAKENRETLKVLAGLRK